MVSVWYAREWKASVYQWEDLPAADEEPQNTPQGPPFVSPGCTGDGGLILTWGTRATERLGALLYYGGQRGTAEPLTLEEAMRAARQ